MLSKTSQNTVDRLALRSLRTPLRMACAIGQHGEVLVVRFGDRLLQRNLPQGRLPPAEVDLQSEPLGQAGIDHVGIEQKRLAADFDKPLGSASNTVVQPSLRKTGQADQPAA